MKEEPLKLCHRNKNDATEINIYEKLCEQTRLCRRDR